MRQSGHGSKLRMLEHIFEPNFINKYGMTSAIFHFKLVHYFSDRLLRYLFSGANVVWLPLRPYKLGTPKFFLVCI